MKTTTRTIFIVLASIIACVVTCDADATRNKKPVPAAPLAKADEATAVVSFIRRTVFVGDAWSYDIWDGDQYVGALGAGSMLQHRATPGEHLFMVMSRGIYKWSFMKADLVAGKEYFARAYPVPFSLQPANANTDERIDEWVTMKVDAPEEAAKQAKWVAKILPDAQGALAAFAAGEVALDCALWFPPTRKGNKHAPASPTNGECRPLGAMKPEFGR